VTRKKLTHPYPQSGPRPEDLLTLVELTPFTRRWKDLELDDEGDLTALQLTVMDDPLRGSVITGTAGLRKLRFVPPRWESGKSGATRVLYVYFAEYHLVLLCLVYAKNERDSISEDTKQRLNGMIADIATELKRRRRLS